MASYRSLLRLALALAIVLALMQKAGQPGAYRLFFPESKPVVPVTDPSAAKKSAAAIDENKAVIEGNMPDTP